MISEAAIILANMRGGYANVGATVHTLLRMSRRPAQTKADFPEGSRTSNAAETPEDILRRLELSR